MEPRLRVKSGEAKDKVFPLPLGRGITLGNAQKQSDIHLADPKLSPVHCRVLNNDGTVTVTDLQSQAGVFVNGQRVGQRELGHGDVLKIGDTELAYESIGEWNVPSSPGESRMATSFDDTVVYDAPRAHEHVNLGELGVPSAPTSLDDVRQLANTGFGKFMLGPVLGSGHHGVVFRARRNDGSELALKVLDPAFPHAPAEAAHFKEVMQARLKLRHPNVITLTSIGRHSTCSWLALELVEGESLAQRVSHFGTSGLPAWTEAYRMMVHVARALHFASRHHLVHRALMPTNVLYRPLDHLYKLADLALCDALAGSQLSQMTLRARGRAQLAYLAPEQLRSPPVSDARSDLYSLGALTYLMLTGKPPFVGKNPTEIAALIREGIPAPPRQQQKSMPEDLEAAVLTLLAKRPEDRFPSAADLLRELAQIDVDPA